MRADGDLLTAAAEDGDHTERDRGGPPGHAAPHPTRPTEMGARNIGVPPGGSTTLKSVKDTDPKKVGAKRSMAGFSTSTRVRRRWPD